MGPAAPPRVWMRIVAWGVDEAATEVAVRMATHGPSRQGWQVREGGVTRLGGPRCPINLSDDGAVATGRGERWAYAVYPSPVASAHRRGESGVEARVDCE